MFNYTVVMNTCKRSGEGPTSQLPIFFMPASSSREAITKVRAMFGEEINIEGMVMRAEPYCDQTLEFNE